MKKAELVIFDMDGIIVDTAKYHYQAWKTVLMDHWGISHVLSVDEKTKGVGRYECMKLIADEYQINAPEEELYQVANEKNELYKMLLREKLTDQEVLPGIRDVMEMLHKNQILIALASSSYNAPYIVEKLNLEFDYIVNPASIRKGKPAPDIYLAAAEHFDIPIDYCIGVEDAASGVRSIKSAGMFCIGVGNSKLLRGADVIIDTTLQLPEVMEEILKNHEGNREDDLGERRTLDWETGGTVGFDINNGVASERKATERTLSQMAGAYQNEDAVKAILAKEDPIIYTFYELDVPEHEGDIAFGTTIIYPGTVGDEYFMTKGHYHNVIDTAEIYYGFQGEGYIITENAEGDVRNFPISQGKAVYVGKAYAHRTVNTGDDPLVCFFAFRADAGHNYKGIEEKGFHTIVLRSREGKPILMKNQKWIDGELDKTKEAKVKW